MANANPTQSPAEKPEAPAVLSVPEGDFATALESRLRQLNGLLSVLTLNAIKEIGGDETNPEDKANALDLASHVGRECEQLFHGLMSAPAR